ncbi:Conserved hypothetical protein [Shewanella piezotolerans WP3]|uniref:PepSY domain-containing protein n=1 Tax=Shewanella piezotolerans (strain WP3 / JCM 13877) TaxID=225849 RepID=B8CQ31_SHEPW|nr:DUF6488 family protein [Shewanella piezotolerans]ACJ29894.1 Conserved hypothetical protein [Shewanella piezotolerans WP3]
MNKLSVLICAGLMALSTQAFAHGDSHSTINADMAIKQAQTSAKMLAVKDHGMSVGKLDDSWSLVATSEFVMAEEVGDGYVIKGYNAKIEQTLYFSVDKSGKVTAVERRDNFKTSHGHAH